MKTYGEQCPGCGAIRRLLELRSPLHDNSYMVRLVCRYCLDRLRAHPDARFLFRWPAILVSEFGPRRIVSMATEET